MPFENGQFSKLIIIHFKLFSNLGLCDKIQINNSSELRKTNLILFDFKEIFDEISLKSDALYPLPFEK